MIGAATKEPQGVHSDSSSRSLSFPCPKDRQEGFRNVALLLKLVMDSAMKGEDVRNLEFLYSINIRNEISFSCQQEPAMTL